MSRKTTWIVAAALAAAIVVSTAAAATKPLQLRRLTATRQDDYLRLRINLNQAWQSGALARGKGTTMTVFYETTGDNKTDYVGKITFHNHRLYEQISGRGNDFPEVLVNRPSKTEARFQHPSDVFFPEPAVPGVMKLVVILKQPGYVTDRLPRKGWWPIPRPQ